jgi:oxygen-dependent protoporphyrinogen oxidase
MFMTLREGLSSLVQAIAARLPKDAVRLNTLVAGVGRCGDQWRVQTTGSAGENFDAVILATPSSVTAKLLEPTDATAAADLASITHSGTAILSLGFAVEQIGHPLNGMGMVVPSIERSPILACSFSSRKYPHRTPPGKELLRVFVGGARHPELAEMADGELLPMVLKEIRKLFRIEGDPCYCNIAHWPRTMPQYHVGHKELIARIESRVALLPHLALAGNAYHGVGLPDCIHSGETAAEGVLRTMAVA